MIRINLLPVREARRKAGLRQQVVVWAGSVLGALALAWAVHAYISHDIDTAERRIQGLQAQLKQYEPQKAELEQFKQKKTEIEQKLAAIDRLERSRSGPVRMMDELATHVPERVWLTGLRTQNGSVELDGMSLDNELVAALLTRLEASPFFRQVELQGTELKQVNDLKLNTFRIRAVLVIPGLDEAQEGEAAGAGTSS